VLRLYPSSVETHISLSLDKPECNSSRVDIKPDHNNHIKVAQGYTNSGFWNITSMSLIPSPVHLPAVLTIPPDVTSAAHSAFFVGKFKTPNITQESKDVLRPITAHGEFINAPYNRFGIFLHWYGRLCPNLIDLASSLLLRTPRRRIQR